MDQSPFDDDGEITHFPDLNVSLHRLKQNGLNEYETHCDKMAWIDRINIRLNDKLHDIAEFKPNYPYQPSDPYERG